MQNTERHRSSQPYDCKAVRKQLESSLKKTAVKSCKTRTWGTAARKQKQADMLGHSRVVRPGFAVTGRTTALVLRRPPAPITKKKPAGIDRLAFCTLDRIRTCDPQLRRLLLYPAELRAHIRLLQKKSFKITVFSVLMQEFIRICRK